MLENVSERLELKRSLLRSLFDRTREDVILASDTSGIPVSALRAYLRPAIARGNVEVRVNAHATRIVFDGDVAHGVD